MAAISQKRDDPEDPAGPKQPAIPAPTASAQNPAPDALRSAADWPQPSSRAGAPTASGGRSGPAPSDPAAAAERLLKRLEAKGLTRAIDALAAERRAAPGLVGELLARPDAAQAAAADSRFATAEVVWRLLEVSRQETAAAALRQLALASEIAGHLDGAHCASDLPAQLRVEVACETALRLIDHGDAAAAAGALHAAVSHLRPDLGYARAVYCRALAKLRRAQRRWEEALALADRAARLLRHHGTAPERAAAIVEQGWLMLEAGDADEAVPLFTRALASVDTVPYPAIYCRLGLAVALVESGQAAESGDIDQLLVDSEWMIGQTRLPIDPHRLRSLAAQAAARCRRDRSR